MEDKKLAIYLDFRKNPELYRQIVTLAEMNQSTAPRIAKKLITDGLSLSDNMERIAAVVKPKIKKVAK